MPTKREKRLFYLAEILAADLNSSPGPVQPEDCLEFLQCHVPMTEEEQEEDFEETTSEAATTQSRGSSALQRLRAALGYTPGDSLLNVIEKAANVCEQYYL